MKVIIYDFDEKIPNKKSSIYFMVGRFIGDEDLAQVFRFIDINYTDIDTYFNPSFKHLTQEIIGICSFNTHSFDEILSKVPKEKEFPDGKYIYCHFDEKKPEAFLIKPDNKKELIKIVLLSQTQNKFSRIEKILNSKLLSKKEVSIIGLGSGGSKVALELVKCGIGSINLIDYDILEEQNIIRHICGYPDIGRYKTKAVKDFLHLSNPSSLITTYEFDIRKNTDLFRNIVKKSDLIIAATGVPQTNHLINGICIQENTDAVYAGVYERGSGGFVMRVIPHKTPCYDCVYDVIQRTSPPVHLTDEQRARYSTIEDASELKAEPGISTDIGFICLLQSKMALLTLLKNEDTELEDIPHNFLLWFNKSYGPFRPMSLKKVIIKEKEKCATCQRELWEKETLKEMNLEPSQIDTQIQEILKEITYDSKEK